MALFNPQKPPVHDATVKAELTSSRCGIRCVGYHNPPKGSFSPIPTDRQMPLLPSIREGHRHTGWVDVRGEEWTDDQGGRRRG